ncbi:lysophospholipid acyltransferase family protein [Microbacterium aurum]
MREAEWIREYPRLVTAPTPAPDAPGSEPTAASDIEEGQVPGIGATYVLGRWVIAPLARLIYRPRIEGRKNFPRKGAVILASNHLFFIDSFVIPMAAPRPVRFLAKSSYFDGKGVRGWFSREFFYAVGAFPVQRGAGQAALDALDQQRRMLEAGWSTALYPEGTRSLDGRLYKGRTGVAFLALQTGAPVIPVGLVGTNEIMPVGAKFPRLRPRVTVRFGEPLDLSHHGSAESGKARRLATDEIMAAIHALSGQELANAYNEAPAANPVERLKQVLPHERR